MLLLAFIFAARFHVSGFAIILSMLAAIVYSAGYLFFFKGFEKGNVSIVAATMNLWAVFTMLFAFTFMGQRLSVTQTLGVFMIISGATLASLNLSDIRNQGFRLSAGVREAILGAFFFGIFWNISEVISEELGWLLTTLLIKLGIVISLLVFSALVKQQIALSQTDARIKYTVAAMGVIEAGAVALVNYGLIIGDAILITPIASALSIVTITLAILFLKEKITKLQGVGILAAVVGIVLTAF
jgi:transporter family protein